VLLVTTVLGFLRFLKHSVTLLGFKSLESPCSLRAHPDPKHTPQLGKLTVNNFAYFFPTSCECEYRLSSSLCANKNDLLLPSPVEYVLTKALIGRGDLRFLGQQFADVLQIFFRSVNDILAIAPPHA
jgi:hypothetical protein